MSGILFLHKSDSAECLCVKTRGRQPARLPLHIQQHIQQGVVLFGEHKTEPEVLIVQKREGRAVPYHKMMSYCGIKNIFRSYIII